MRHDLLRELASRIKATPDVLVEQEIDRRLEEFVRRLMEQGIDPDEGRTSTGRSSASGSAAPAAETVKSTLVVDEIARREAIEATDEDVDERDRAVRRARRPDAGGGPGAAREGRRARPRSAPASAARRRWPGSSSRRTSRDDVERSHRRDSHQPGSMNLRADMSHA